jgi:tetratricopeptide (TPR) repeat protein
MDISTFYKEYLNATPQELAPHGYVLQDLIRRYPWFSLGHFLLFKSLCGMGGDASLSQSEKTAAYVYARQKLYFIVEQSRKDFEKLAEEEFFTLDLPKQEGETTAKQQQKVGSRRAKETPVQEFVIDVPQERTFYPGADYFGKEYMETVQLDVSVPVDRFISESPRFTQALKRAGEDVDTSEQDEPPTLADDEFVTETLAKIYADQGYYKLAVACYAKLILLYPEKSTYFASLAEEIKQKFNN